MTNSKSDKQLNRMMYLMEFNNKSVQTKQPSGIEYHVNANDGKTYGIIRENNMYYIKTTTPDKAALKESYEYINGYSYRNENGYKSYNEATKQLELKLMSINESCGKHEDVSVVNFNKSKENMKVLTEAARKELDRVNQILENSTKIGVKQNIGDHGNPEGKGTATGADTTKNNAPFGEKTEAKLDKDMPLNGTVDKATSDYKKVGEPKMDSTKAPKCQGKCAEKNKDVHDDLEGEGVADKKPKGGKAVMVKESCLESGEELRLYGDESMTPDVTDPMIAKADSMEDIDMTDFNDDDLAGMGEEEPIDELGDDEYLSAGDELDELLREFMDVAMPGSNSNVSAVPSTNIAASPTTNASIPMPMEEDIQNNGIQSQMPQQDVSAGGGHVNGTTDNVLTEDDLVGGLVSGVGNAVSDIGNSIPLEEDKIVGPDDVMDNYKSKKGTDSKGAEWERINEDETQEAKQGDEETMKSFQKKGNMPAQSWDKMNESVDRIVEMVCNKLCGKQAKAKKKETLDEAVNRIVKEEVTRLDAFGKHPRYGKQPMTTPANKEVLAGTAEKDWNDDSTKGEQPYGQKIGSSAPFNKQVEVITDAVVNMIKEGKLGLKKK